MPKKSNEYTFFAFSENPNEHYARRTRFNLNSPLSNILDEFYKQTYLQPYPAIFVYFLEDIQYSNKIYTPNPTKPQRGGHGASHATRVAIASVIFFRLYETYGSEQTKQKISELIASIPGKDTEEQRLRFIKLLQIAAAFHDAGRQGGGKDREEWEKQGSEDCKILIFQLLKNSEPNISDDNAQSIANAFAHAIHKKDSPLQNEKPLLNSFVQCADCLDIMRGKSVFNINFLDIWQDSLGVTDRIDEDKSLYLQKDILEITFEWQNLLNRQGIRNRSAITAYVVEKTGQKFSKATGSDLVSIAPCSVKKHVNSSTYETNGLSAHEQSITCLDFPTLHRMYYPTHPSTHSDCPDDFEIQLNNYIETYRQRAAYLKDTYGKRNNDSAPIRLSIERVIPALIRLKHEMKSEEQMAYSKNDSKSLNTIKIIRSATINLMKEINTFYRSINAAGNPGHHFSKPITVAIEHYNAQVVPLLNNTQLKLATAAAFLLIATVFTVSAILIAPYILVASMPLFISTTALGTFLASAAGSKQIYDHYYSKGLFGSVRNLRDNIDDAGIAKPLLLER